MSDKQPFDPSPYMSKVGGADYLEVKYRLLWLRKDHPDAVIETELVNEMLVYSGRGQTREATFKARVTLPSGASATGYGSETHADFPAGHKEKAETKALGRALAALGFGTQFSGNEWGGEADANRPVDSPVARPQQQRPQQRPQQGYAQQRPQGDPNRPASEKQIKYIRDLVAGIGISPDEFDFADMTAGEASKWIESLREGRIPEGQAPTYGDAPYPEEPPY